MHTTWSRSWKRSSSHGVADRRTETPLDALHVYPMESGLHPEQREPLRSGWKGQWLTCDQALAEPLLSLTARSVFAALKEPG